MFGVLSIGSTDMRRIRPVMMPYGDLFSQKGQTTPCQVVVSFRPAIAREYRLAQANMAYSRFSFFLGPRYAVFL